MNYNNIRVMTLNSRMLLFTVCYETKKMKEERTVLLLFILPQLSRCAYKITFRKPYIASLEIWTIGLWMVGLLDCLVGNLDDCTLDCLTI